VLRVLISLPVACALKPHGHSHGFGRSHSDSSSDGNGRSYKMDIIFVSRFVSVFDPLLQTSLAISLLPEALVLAISGLRLRIPICAKQSPGFSLLFSLCIFFFLGFFASFASPSPSTPILLLFRLLCVTSTFSSHSNPLFIQQAFNVFAWLRYELDRRSFFNDSTKVLVVQPFYILTSTFGL
jgi:hypothetical protein